MGTESTALAKSENTEKRPARTRTSYSDLAELNLAMRNAMRNANVITPIVAIDHIPMFHEVSLRMVQIDAREMRDGGEVYYISGGYGLGKTALAKLSQAARIAWDPVLSRRLDDGSDPLYVHYQAVGYWPDFDGKTVLPIDDHKQLDLREGSDMVAKILSESKTEEKGQKSLRQMRAFILEHAATKAMNRAIRKALALKSKYTEDELWAEREDEETGEKRMIPRPWVVPTLIETGRCDDPELRRLYYEKKLEGKGLAMRALFGGSDPRLKSGGLDVIDVKAEPVPDRAAATQEKHPPPPVGTPADLDDEDSLDPFGNGR